jgi:uncharacterized repeat protein (TIGR03803 family)
MTNPAQRPILASSSRVQKNTFAAALLCMLTVIAFEPVQAQVFTVIHNFTGGTDGAWPIAGLKADAMGNLYGTTFAGGYNGNDAPCDQVGCGTVFKLRPAESRWSLTPLYTFHGSDGYRPTAGVIFGADGILYSTTFEGGAYNGGVDGTVFSLQPSTTVCGDALCPWDETLLWNFMGSPDGVNPSPSDLIFDNAGNLYGTTQSGGYFGEGTVYKLTPISGGGWSESIIYSFGSSSNGTPGGVGPADGVIFDNYGNMYATAEGGGSYGCGTVSQLVSSATGWTENVLYSFSCSSYNVPQGGLIFDQSGNLYGTTSYTGTFGGGAVFEMTSSNGGWTFNVLHSFTGLLGSSANLTMDSAGNLYGTTVSDGAYQDGNVFELSPFNGGWTYTSLHDFTGGKDGGSPQSQVLIDEGGNLYGTAENGGTGSACGLNCGVVWEITAQSHNSRY